KLNGEYGKVCDDLKALKEQQAAEKAAAEQAAADAKEAKERLSEFERKYGSPAAGGVRFESYGARFIKAVGGDAAAWETVYQNQRTDKRRLAGAAAAYLAGGVAMLRKDISGDAASAGALQDSLRIPGVVTPPDTAFAVQDLLPRQTTTNRSVDYVRELVLTNAAAPVAENEAV